MKTIYTFVILSTLVFLSACAGFRVAGEVEAGRQALLTGKPDAALARFQNAAQMDPAYVMKFSPLQQSVWTYLGKTYYTTGKLAEARQALERASSMQRDDHLARLYLGLTLSKNGSREKGLREIESGMKGLHDWLEFISYNTTYGEFWDPSRKIRSELETNLAMISGKDIEWQRLLSGGEWIGKKLEAEIDLARRDRALDRRGDRDDNDGGEEP